MKLISKGLIAAALLAGVGITMRASSHREALAAQRRLRGRRDDQPTEKGGDEQKGSQHGKTRCGDGRRQYCIAEIR